MNNRRKCLIIWIISVFLIAISAIKITMPFIQSESVKNVVYNSVNKIKTHSGNFSFAVLGDNKNSISTFGKIIEQINTNPEITFVVNTGDMVFDGSVTKYNFFLKQLSKLQKPFIPVPGNHDIADGGMNNYVEFFGPLYYAFAVDQVYFIVLDSSNEETIGAWQMKWLEEQLKNSQKHKYRFVFLHVPIFDPRLPMDKQPGHSLKNTKNAMELLKLLQKYNVTMVFAGHIHGYFRGEWEGVPYIVTGGAGAELVGLNKEHYFYHYLIVRVKDTGIDYEVVKVNSPDFNVIDRIGAFLWLYLYSFVVINYWWIVFIIGVFIFTILLVRGFKKEIMNIWRWLMKRRIIRFISRLFVESKPH
ncbi:metallophosphoesterase family protein [Kosmotoga olearia]|uniref:Metallophosphoesterase n=1 Tax=Kosmotoga olearia (strain ATCC BAA-1733 / DSM 21960 / TBF 19.5.1) TaxID=521045 RepID=C5CDX7_KOSOT|nr:metallophosphoesterase [Kosmotoga olearia]ACR79146.1 metallophosphoesterase [Kosmotoga olearia TBF 19.5.1]